MPIPGNVKGLDNKQTFQVLYQQALLSIRCEAMIYCILVNVTLKKN